VAISAGPSARRSLTARAPPGRKGWASPSPGRAPQGRRRVASGRRPASRGIPQTPILKPARGPGRRNRAAAGQHQTSTAGLCGGHQRSAQPQQQAAVGPAAPPGHGGAVQVPTEGGACPWRSTPCRIQTRHWQVFPGQQAARPPARTEKAGPSAVADWASHKPAASSAGSTATNTIGHLTPPSELAAAATAA